MAEAIGLGASIIAVVELAGRIATACKFYIETVRDYPRDLRLIYVEVGALKVVFEGLNYLDQDDPLEFSTLKALEGSNGPIELCKEAIQELEKLFPGCAVTTGAKRKRKTTRKVHTALTSLAWPLKAEKSQKLLKEIMQHKSTISMALQGQLLCGIQNIRREVHRISVSLNASEKRTVVNWLRGPLPQITDPRSLHDTAKTLYEKGTGDWVYKTPEWESWISLQDRSLWLYGIPGAGKTVLASHIIERMRDICAEKDKQTCVYYYCHHSHNQDESEPFLRWLVSQLVGEQQEVPEIIWKAYKRQGTPDRQLLLDALEEVLSLLDRVYVGIDALDESQNVDRLLALLETLVTDVRFSKLQLFAASREYEAIKREMQKLSRSISMSNSFVEADIRTYVSAKIKENPKFQRWPQDLKTEVEDTLTTGAKGMFRWAVCQLDILRRLHHQSKIRKAIRSLPETLYETYERIFSYISPEEQDLVKHALHWACFHDFLWSGAVPLPAQVLLDSYTLLGSAGDNSSSGDLLCDLETLKDLCGCLVSFRRNQVSGPQDDGQHGEIATIAHYTVREFLESSRSSNQRVASWMKIHQEKCYSTILRSIFDFALVSEAPPITEDDMYEMDSSLYIHDASDILEYCLACSVRSLTACEELVQPTWAVRLLDPSAQHYLYLHNELESLSMDDNREFLTRKYVLCPFWEVSCAKNSKSSNATILLSLLLMECFQLAKAFVMNVNMKELMEENLSGYVLWKVGWMSDSHGIEVQGNLIDVLIQIRALDTKELDFIQEVADAFIKYHDLLPSFMPSRFINFSDDIDWSDIKNDPLSRLLKRGASPDPKGFRVTPLQIAAYTRDLVGVHILLEAGADPNNTGNPLGISWCDEHSVLKPYNKLHGYTPVDILTDFKALFYYDDAMDSRDRKRANEEVTDKIRQVLLSWGAVTGSGPNGMLE